MKVDLHVHSCYSHDCCTPLEVIVQSCLRKRIQCIALSDHNTIQGALELKKLAPFKVIVSEEVMTTDGEIMGLFLKEEIPQGLSPEETIERIKKQGGLVNIPHPYGRWPMDKNSKLLVPDIMRQVDLVEVFNARSPLHSGYSKACELAERHNLPMAAGSDAHTSSEIGRAYIKMADFDSPDSFLSSLEKGEITGQRSSPFVHFATTMAKIRKKHISGIQHSSTS